MDKNTLALVLVVGLDADVMHFVFLLFGDILAESGELDEIVLHIEVGSDVVRIGSPVELSSGTHLMFGDSPYLGEERIARLEAILEVAFALVGLDAYEGFCGP